MCETSRVLRAYAFDDWRLEPEAIPAPGAGELLCRLRLAGVCSGEAMPWYVDRKAPVVLGHELVAEVVACGRGVDAFAVGQRVFSHHHAACGTCAACSRGLESNCELFRKTSLRPGGYAEYFVVPAPNVQLDTLLLPETLSDDRAVFVEPLACCVRALERAAPQAGDRVLVIGAGCMGLLNVMLARALPHREVVCAELQPVRRERALAAGAHRVLDPAVDCDDEPYDVVVVCPSSTAAIRQGLDVAAPGGRVVLFAPPPAGSEGAVDWCRLYFREVTISSAYSCGPADTRRALQWLATGAVAPETLITDRVGLDEVAGVVQRIAAGDPALGKAVVDPQRDAGKDAVT